MEDHTVDTGAETVGNDDALATRRHVSERLAFEIDPAIIHHIIHSQAGSIGKALIELLMNSVDACASYAWLTIDRAGFECVDNGNGFATREDVIRYFGKFGTPHIDGDARYGRFRLGRGQIMAHASTVWQSKRWTMEVDTRTHGHVYDLSEHAGSLGSGSGCAIKGRWYAKLSESELQSTMQEVRDLVRYTPIAVSLNGQQISKDPAKERWDFEDDVAFYRVKAEGAVSIYNQGVLVRHDPGSAWGAGGIIVSKQPIDLNVSRTEVLRKTCSTWAHIAAVFGPLADALSDKLADSRKTEERRQKSVHALLAGEGDLLGLALKEEVITILPGKRHITLEDFLGRLWRQAKSAGESAYVSVVDYDVDIPVGEAIAGLGIVLVVHPQTLERFRCTTELEFAESLSRIQENVLRSLGFGKSCSGYWIGRPFVSPRFVDFTVLRENFIDRTHLLVDEKKALDRETRRAWTALKWCLFQYAATCLDLPMYASGHVIESARSKVPLMILGESNIAEAWTDGSTYVAFDIKHVKKLRTQPLLAVSRMFSLLEHELSHHGDSLTAGHDDMFYQRHHDLCMRMAEHRQRYTHFWLKKYTLSLSQEGKSRSGGGRAWYERRLVEMAGDGREKRGLDRVIDEEESANALAFMVPEPPPGMIDAINGKLVDRGDSPPAPDWDEILVLARDTQVEADAEIMKRWNEERAEEDACRKRMDDDATERGRRSHLVACRLGVSKTEFLEMGGAMFVDEYYSSVDELESIEEEVLRVDWDTWLLYFGYRPPTDAERSQREALDRDADTFFAEEAAIEEANRVGVSAAALLEPGFPSWMKRLDLVRPGETRWMVERNAAAAGFMDLDAYLVWRTETSEGCC